MEKVCIIFVLLLLTAIACYPPDPIYPIYDSGIADCEQAVANAGHCVGLEAPGGDGGTVPFSEWCEGTVFLDKACIAKASDCDASVRCLEN